MIPPPHKAKRYNWHLSRNACLAIFAAIIIGLSIAVVIIAIIVASNQGSLQRYCVTATPENVVGGAGEAGGNLIGTLSLFTNEREIEYNFQYLGLSTITALHVRGPITLGTQVGPLAFSLCGSPSTIVCDLITMPGVVKGLLTQISPGNTSPRPEILAIRNNPSLYYLEVLTTNNPATPGALRAPLDNICGTP